MQRHNLIHSTQITLTTLKPEALLTQPDPLVTQKNKKLSLPSDLSLPKIQKLSHTIAQT